MRLRTMSEASRARVGGARTDRAALLVPRFRPRARLTFTHYARVCLAASVVLEHRQQRGGANHAVRSPSRHHGPHAERTSPGRDFDLPRHCTLSLLPGVIPMVFEHSGGRDFDLPRHSHYSGVIHMVFEHSGGRDFDLPRHSHYSGVIPMVFEHSASATYRDRSLRNEKRRPSAVSAPTRDALLPSLLMHIN